MRIGFDGKRAVQNFTGLGNYSRYIVDILCQFYPENEYVLYAPKKQKNWLMLPKQISLPANKKFSPARCMIKAVPRKFLQALL